MTMDLLASNLMLHLHMVYAAPHTAPMADAHRAARNELAKKEEERVYRPDTIQGRRCAR